GMGGVARFLRDDLGGAVCGRDNRRHDARDHDESLFPAASITMTPSRRDFLKFSLGGTGTLFLPKASLLQAATPHDEPHFFLMIVLNGGADSSYMFDARPPSMTQAGQNPNYPDPAPVPCDER